MNTHAQRNKDHRNSFVPQTDVEIYWFRRTTRSGRGRLRRGDQRQLRRDWNYLGNNQCWEAHGASTYSKLPSHRNPLDQIQAELHKPATHRTNRPQKWEFSRRRHRAHWGLPIEHDEYEDINVRSFRARPKLRQTG